MTLPPGHGQLALVACYGDKRHRYPELWGLMEDLQQRIAGILGDGIFLPYSEDRIHATVIGLEAERHGECLWNRNEHRRHGGEKQIGAMDLEAVLRFLVKPNELLPLRIQFGGFHRARSYPFNSQGHHPYLRSFSTYGSTAVIVGWPWGDGEFNCQLDELRRSFNQFNVLHKYHDSPTAYDNDCYLVLGHISKQAERRAVELCTSEMREMMSQRTIPPIVIGRDQLKIVAYREGDTTLMDARAWSLQEAVQYRAKLVDWYPGRAKRERL